MILNQDQIDQFFSQGFLVLNSYLSDIELKDFRDECDNLIEYTQFKKLNLVQDLGCIIEPWTFFLKLIDNETQLTYSRYRSNLLDFQNLRSWGSEFDLVNFIKQRLLNLVTPLIEYKNGQAQDIYLFNEQYIVKPNGHSTQFKAHRDNEHLPQHCQNIFNTAIWINLDDINEKTGHLYFHLLNQPKEIVKLSLKPGSIVLIHSDCYHFSEANQSNELRRAYMIQFTEAPLKNGNNNSELISLGVKI